MGRAEEAELHALFEELYNEFKTPIYNYLYHLIGNREQADDLTQDTFVKVLGALPRTDLTTLKRSSWIYRIATNVAYDVLRRRKLINWTSWEELEQEPLTVQGNELQELIEAGELVVGALQLMPFGYRTALVMYTQEGAGYSEIATRLGITESGVKMYLTRARQAFRENYRRLEDGASPERKTGSGTNHGKKK